MDQNLILNKWKKGITDNTGADLAVCLTHITEYKSHIEHTGKIELLKTKSFKKRIADNETRKTELLTTKQINWIAEDET